VQWRHSRKRKDRMKLSLPPKLMVFWVSPLLEWSCTFLQVFSQSHPMYDHRRVLMLCFHYFTDTLLGSKFSFTVQSTKQKKSQRQLVAVQSLHTVSNLPELKFSHNWMLTIEVPDTQSWITKVCYLSYAYTLCLHP
jgi:hypothetical protein